jgi:hypothetical protein
MLERKIVAEGSFEGSRKYLRGSDLKEIKKIKDYYLYKMIKKIKTKKFGR